MMKQPVLRQVAVIGAGMSIFGKQTERTFIDLATEACRAAIKDAGVNPKEIEGTYCANLQSDYGKQHAVCLAQEVASKVGVVNGEMMTIENACAGGSTAVRRMFLDIAMGMYDIGMAFGVDSMTRALKKGTLLSTEDIDGLLGNSMPAYGAMQMRRHMELYGTTLEQFAQVSVKNHHNGCLNPYSQYHEEMTVEQVLNSRIICDPLTILEVCPYTDGAAAIILCAANKVRRYTSHPVWVVGSGLMSGTYAALADNICASTMGEQAAREAYEMASIGPEDVDLVELHDAFAAVEIMNTEDLLLCPRGEGGRLVSEGITWLGGKCPVNPSGGLISQGHPISASGVRQICEITWHLRGQAGTRQVEGAKVGVAHMEGGVIAGLQGGACCVNILKV